MFSKLILGVESLKCSKVANSILLLLKYTALTYQFPRNKIVIYLSNWQINNIAPKMKMSLKNLQRISRVILIYHLKWKRNTCFVYCNLEDNILNFGPVLINKFLSPKNMPYTSVSLACPYQKQQKPWEASRIAFGVGVTGIPERTNHPLNWMSIHA